MRLGLAIAEIGICEDATKHLVREDVKAWMDNLRCQMEDDL